MAQVLSRLCRRREFSTMNKFCFFLALTISFHLLCPRQASHPPKSLHESPDQDIIAKSASMIRESFKAEAEGRLDDALKIAAKLPQDAFAVFRQGKLLFKMGRIRQALAAFSAVESVEPSMSLAVTYKAFSLYRLGEFKSCAALAARALNISVTDNRAAVALELCSKAEGSQQHHQPLLSQHRAASLSKHASGGREVRTGRNHSSAVGGATRVHPRTSRGLVLVTSANSLYFDCAANLVGSAQLREPDMRIAIYDLGLDAFEQAHAILSSYYCCSFPQTQSSTPHHHNRFHHRYHRRQYNDCHHHRIAAYAIVIAIRKRSRSRTARSSSRFFTQRIRGAAAAADPRADGAQRSQLARRAQGGFPQPAAPATGPAQSGL